MDDDRSGDDSSRDASGGEEPPPLSELTERIRRKQSETIADDSMDPLSNEQSLGEGSSLFKEESIGEIDPDGLWASIESDWPFQADPSEEFETDAEHVVPKQWYCERCEYFSDPPRVDCNHAGTSIEEFVDSEHVRVRNCPVVEQRQRLGEFGAVGPPAEPID